MEYFFYFYLVLPIQVQSETLQFLQRGLPLSYLTMVLGEGEGIVVEVVSGSGHTESSCGVKHSTLDGAESGARLGIHTVATHATHAARVPQVLHVAARVHHISGKLKKVKNLIINKTSGNRPLLVITCGCIVYSTKNL